MGIFYSRPQYYVDNNNQIVTCMIPGMVLIFGDDSLTMKTGTIFSPKVTQIFYKDILSVSFSPGNPLVDGRFAITTPGGTHVAKLVSGNLGLDEVAQLVYKRRDEALSHSSQSQPSAADEIAKYKNLADQGIITMEEFEKKKKQLLGL